MKKALKIAVNVILWVFVAFSAMTMVLSLNFYFLNVRFFTQKNGGTVLLLYESENFA